MENIGIYTEKKNLPKVSSKCVNFALALALASGIFQSLQAQSKTKNSTLAKNNIVAKEYSIKEDKKKELTTFEIDSLENLNKTQKVLDVVNQYRQKNGLRTLVFDKNLNIAAEKYAKYIFDNNMAFDHTDLEGNFPSDRAYKAGYEFGFVGENLYMGVPPVGSESNSVVQAWKDSPEHNRNLLGKGATCTGVGFFKFKNGDSDGYICVMLFGNKAAN